MKKHVYLLLSSIALFFVSYQTNAEPVFAVKADIYKLKNEITIDSKISETLNSFTPIHQPMLLALLNESAQIEIGDKKQLTSLEIKANEDGSFFNASMKLKDKTDGQWQSITSFMPNIPSGQAVYFSRTFIDSVWLIKLTGTRYESEELGLASFKKQ